MANLTENQQEDASRAAIFIWNGAIALDVAGESRWNDTVSNHYNGQVDFAMQCMQWATMLILEEIDFKKQVGIEDYPGVFDYEVSEAMGHWVANQWKEFKFVSDEEFVAHAKRVVQEFFLPSFTPEHRPHDEGFEE